MKTKYVKKHNRDEIFLNIILLPNFTQMNNHKSAAAVLMDLSKAFDFLSHGLLIEKLRAYGLAPEAIDLLSSYMYLSDRVQQV